MARITLNLPPHVEAELRRLALRTGTDPAAFASASLAAQIERLKQSVTDYQAGRLSLGAFAEGLGLSVIEADELLGRLEIAPAYEPGQAARDADRVEQLLGSERP